MTVSGTRSAESPRAAPRLRLAALAVVMILSASTSACVTSFSELQSARLAGMGRMEITPAYTSTSISSDGESDQVQTHLGVHLATGVSNAVDLRLRFERISLSDDDESDGINILGIGPKFRLSGNQLAAFLPIGFAFGSGIEVGDTFEFHPTVLWTIPLSQNFEINTSGKGIVPFHEDGEFLMAFNAGLGLSSDLDKWVIRPEYGILKNPGEDGTASQFSIGFTLFTGTRR